MGDPAAQIQAHCIVFWIYVQYCQSHDESQNQCLRCAQSHAAPRRHIRHAGGRQERRVGGSHADSRRRGYGQDQYVGASHGAPGGERRGSGAHSHADLHAPLRPGNDPAHAEHRGGSDGGSRPGGRSQRGDAPVVVGNLSFRGQPHTALVRQALGARSEFHRPRSRGCGGLDGRGASRIGFLGQGQALSAQGCLPRHLFLPGQHATDAEANPRRTVPVVPRVGSRPHAPVPRICGPQAKKPGAGFRRFAAVLACDDAKPHAGAELVEKFRSCAGG